VRSEEDEGELRIRGGEEGEEGEAGGGPGERVSPAVITVISSTAISSTAISSTTVSYAHISLRFD
jgi:hypothetical protein